MPLHCFKYTRACMWLAASSAEVRYVFYAVVRPCARMQHFSPGPLSASGCASDPMRDACDISRQEHVNIQVPLRDIPHNVFSRFHLVTRLSMKGNGCCRAIERMIAVLIRKQFIGRGWKTYTVYRGSAAEEERLRLTENLSRLRYEY